MPNHPRTIALLETMWDWQQHTSAANPNYLAQAPRCFRINPQNHSGGRLYNLLGHSNLLVTNVCPQLVLGANRHGKPDVQWTQENLEQLYPFNLLLVCGKVAQATFDQCNWAAIGVEYRIVYMPHPAARMWTCAALARAKVFIQEGTSSVNMYMHEGRLVVKLLTP